MTDILLWLPCGHSYCINSEGRGVREGAPAPPPPKKGQEETATTNSKHKMGFPLYTIISQLWVFTIFSMRHEFPPMEQESHPSKKGVGYAQKQSV